MTQPARSQKISMPKTQVDSLVVRPPIKPMLAKAVTGIPSRADLIFEPKWDGFRCVVFRSGKDVHLGSRNTKPLTRYFPELIGPLRAQFPQRCVVDCEIIVAVDDRIGFEALQQRIHPAESRIAMLADTTPAELVIFDLLALGDRDFRTEPFQARREALLDALANVSMPLHLTPATTDTRVAARWFEEFEGAGLDGLIAKPKDDPYVENKRTQLKIKHVRTADVVVAGYRMHKDGEGVGSLLLGLYDERDELAHVGVAASFTRRRRAELVEELRPFREGALDLHPWATWVDGDHQRNRWNAQKDMSWVPVRVERVAEVRYGSTLNGRFRDVTRWLRWREDKEPYQCRFDQLDEPEPVGLSSVLSAAAGC